MTMTEQLLATGPKTAGAPAPDAFAGPVGRAFRQMLLSEEIIGQVLSEVGPDGLRLRECCVSEGVRSVVSPGLRVRFWSDHGAPILPVGSAGESVAHDVDHR